MISNANAQLKTVSNRGLYVDHGSDFLTKAGAEVEQTQLLDYCFSNKITYIMLDGLSGTSSEDVFNTSSSGPLINDINAQKLSAFIERSKSYGIEEVGVGIESEAGANAVAPYNGADLLKFAQLIDGVVKYNSLSRYTGKINVLEAHYEFWRMNQYDPNPAVSKGIAYGVFKKILKKAFDAKQLYPENYLRIDTYVADYDNDTIDDDLQAQQISELADRVYLVKYTTSINSIYTAGVRQRIQNFGRNTAKKIELWTMLSCQESALGPVLSSNPSYNTLDKIDDKWDNDFKNDFNSGSFVNADNFYFGGHMWYRYQDAVNYTAKFPAKYVTLGRHKKKNGNDCPVSLNAFVGGGVAPFKFEWTKEGSSGVLRTFTNPLMGIDTYAPTGLGKFYVTVTDGVGAKLIDYNIIYSDYDMLYPCDPTGEDSLWVSNERFLNQEISSEELLTVSIGESLQLKNLLPKPLEFAIYDVSGKMIQLGSGLIEPQGYYTTVLEKGVYLIRFKDSSGKVESKRFAIY